MSITKGRISIVWEGVNAFSDHYGKRLTLKFTVGKLLSKCKAQSGVGASDTNLEGDPPHIAGDDGQ